jgi:hypothetical protein
MKLGIIGLPQAGKRTVFAALTGARGTEKEDPSRADATVGTVTVHDERLDFLADLYQSKKKTYAKIEYLLPSELRGIGSSKSDRGIWNQVRICDAFLHVVRNFKGPMGSPPSPEEDFWRLEEEMILNDLAVVEKRMERIELERRKGQKNEGDEPALLRSCLETLEKETPLREEPKLRSEPLLKGYTLLTAKPMLVIVNNEDEDESLPDWNRLPEPFERIAVRGRLEMEIASMSPEEAKEFLEMYHIEESALDRVIKESYDLLDLISFFTVISGEVRAWSISAGTSALEAAGTVHSDMKRGFIRAEVVSFDDLKSCGSYSEAKKAGLVRLEGKEYEVKNGDIIHFRFNV